MPDEAQMRS